MRGQQGLAVQVLGQVVEHRAGLLDDGGVFGVQAVHEPAHERDLGQELGAREDVQVGGAAFVAVGLAEAVEERV